MKVGTHPVALASMHKVCKIASVADVTNPPSKSIVICSAYADFSVKSIKKKTATASKNNAMICNLDEEILT